jgi:hypothetical protein
LSKEEGMALSVVLQDPMARKELAREALKILGVERGMPGDAGLGGPLGPGGQSGLGLADGPPDF